MSVGMRHNLPKVPIFNDTPPGGAIEAVAMRVLVAFPNWELHMLGTASLISSYLALTARHVVEQALRLSTVSQVGDKLEVSRGQLQLLQVLPGPHYRFWNVAQLWMTNTDIAILHLALDSASDPDLPISWVSPRVRATPPPTGQKVVAFGYRESVVRPSIGPSGDPHIDINADPSAPPLSYAVTLWPFLTTMISGDRGDKHPRGVRFPAIDLALDNIFDDNAFGGF